MGTTSNAVVRLTQSSTQELGSIKRVIGLMPAKFIVGLIDELDLEANPRNSHLGPVTDAIIKSIVADEQTVDGNKLFPFKSKGILLAASQYESLDRNRYRLDFVKRSTEGILDGGHNTLAVGVYILQQAEKALGKPQPKRKNMRIWESFKVEWNKLRDDVTQYLAMVRDDKAQLISDGVGTLDFSIPVEILLPTDQNDELCIDQFRNSLLEICDARNNNAQLTQGTKGNQEGLFETFKGLFNEYNPKFAGTISWKTNDGKSVQSRNLVALAWIPLSLTTWVSGDDKIVDAPSPVSIYSGKEKCLEKYLELMRRPEISKEAGSAKKELKDIQVESALKIAVKMPEIFDEIYRLFPKYYQGSYGKIGAVKSMLNSTETYFTPFFKHPTNRPVPDGFIYPLVFGMRAIMEYDADKGTVEWKIDPFKFIESDAFKHAVAEYSGVIQQSDYDPQKVGKGAFSYTAAENAMKLAYISLR
ncbi:MAG: hypothetical protein LKF00_04005 [Olsenella sp.]|jgi:hypothetical protein|nr:hypothetical protein [Olsenella sp.]MCI1288539.1 hypothetical protein [Olsenella sp.]